MLFVLSTLGCDEEAEPAPKAEPQQAPAPTPTPATPVQAPEDKAFVESMKTLCRIADEVKADPAVAATARPMETVTRFQATKPPADVLKFLGTMGGIVPEARAEKTAAEMMKHGEPDWACPTLSEVVN
jgi:hypothetical protein